MILRRNAMDKRIGAQLYTVRDFTKTKEAFENTIKKLSEIGYKAVQISAVGDIAPEDMKAICERYNTEIVCTHKAYGDYTERIGEMIDFHKKLGCGIAGLGYLNTGAKTVEEFKPYLDKLNTVSEKLRAEGISFAYHNHHIEFERLDNGKTVMDYMIENGNFDFIVDVYWLAFSGINPSDFIRKLGKRAVVIHYKDLAICDGTQKICEVGKGNLDWDDIVRASEESGSCWALVEQDTCDADPFDSMKISYDYLTAKGFE